MKTKRKRYRGRTGNLKSVGYGYVGEWDDGTLGWFLPAHLTGHNRDQAQPHPEWSNVGEKSYLCKITIERVLRNGKPIVRKVRQE